MRSRFYLPKIFLILLVGSILLTATPKEIWVLEVDGVINPVSASYINDNLRKAQPDQVECPSELSDTQPDRADDFYAGYNQEYS